MASGKAKVNVKFDDKTFSAKVTEAFQKVKQSPQLQKQIGEFLVFRIKGEGKRGRPYNKQRGFPQLKDSTIANRKHLAKYNKTGSPFRPPFSNTTITNQLWSGLEFITGKDFVTIKPNDKTREPYIVSSKGTKQKLKAGVNKTNEDLAKTLKEIGFEIFNASALKQDPKIIARIRSITLRFLRTALKVARLRG